MCKQKLNPLFCYAILALDSKRSVRATFSARSFVMPSAPRSLRMALLTSPPQNHYNLITLLDCPCLCKHMTGRCHLARPVSNGQLMEARTHSDLHTKADIPCRVARDLKRAIAARSHACTSALGESTRAARHPCPPASAAPAGRALADSRFRVSRWRAPPHSSPWPFFRALRQVASTTWESVL